MNNIQHKSTMTKSEKPSSEYYVYILKCFDGTLYTGITNNVKKRIAFHESKKGSKYVRSRLPIKLLYKENCKTKSEALKREIAIKKLSRKDKLEILKY